MVKFFITGGSGFIGSHLTEAIFNEFPNSKIIILDKVTYAADKKYLSKIIKSKRVKFIKNDLCNVKSYEKFLKILTMQLMLQQKVM